MTIKEVKDTEGRLRFTKKQSVLLLIGLSIACSFLSCIGGMEIFTSDKYDMTAKAVIVVGFVLTLWGFVYHTLERVLFFDRRHVTGVNGWLAIVWGNLITYGSFEIIFVSWSIAIKPCIAYTLFSIVIYYLIHYFIEEKQYAPEELYAYPPK